MGPCRPNAIPAVAAAGALALAAAAPGGGHARQLFLDDFVVASVENLSRRFHEPSRHAGNPILTGDEPWERWLIGVNGRPVMYDDETGEFRMWYGTYLPDATAPTGIRYRVCYAVSTDGIHWRRPDLGQVDWEGSRANNIILGGEHWIRRPNVIKDLGDPDPSRRFKMTYADVFDGRTAITKAYSPDGIHWRSNGDGQPWFRKEHGANLLGWDPRVDRYVIFTKMPGAQDSMGRSTSADFITWSEPETVLAPGPAEREANFKGLTAFFYEDLYLGFLYNFKSVAGAGGLVAEAELAMSRDGRSWRRLAPGASYFRLGPPGSWESDGVFPVAPVVHGDRIWVYYCAWNGPYGAADEKRMAAGADRWDWSRFPPESAVDSFFLFGVRGVGKSTWARRQFPEARRIDLLDEGVFQSYLREPQRFGQELRRVARGSWVVVDEVQRLPALLNEVHRAIEELGLRFVLLGSSARKLRAAGTNLLAGRAVRREMHPLQPDEMGADFDLKEVLRYGSLPIIWRAPHKPDRLDAYAQLYLREEIQAEALVRNLPGFARFLPIAALCHGQIVSAAALARDAAVARTTVNGYLEILQDTYLVTLLPAYEARLRVKERKHPKLFLTDPGIVRAMKRQLHEPAPEERGALLEGWVCGLLRARQAYAGLYDELAYWAPAQSGTEVDFLLRRGNSFVAVEVKATAHPARPHFAGLRAIADLAGTKRRILVHMGERAFETPDGIEALPVMQFAEQVTTGRL